MEREWAGSRWVESGLLFTNRHGGPLDGDNVTRGFKRLLEQCGLPRLRFHDLCHSAASLLLAHGVPPRVVMDVLGHSQISVTMNLYTKVIPLLIDDAARAMDRALAVSLAVKRGPRTEGDIVPLPYAGPPIGATYNLWWWTRGDSNP